MRNLSVLRDTVASISAQQLQNADSSSFTQLCTDSDTGNVFLADVTHGTVCCLASNNQVRRAAAARYCSVLSSSIITLNTLLHRTAKHMAYTTDAKGLRAGAMDEKLGGNYGGYLGTRQSGRQHCIFARARGSLNHRYRGRAAACAYVKRGSRGETLACS